MLVEQFGLFDVDEQRGRRRDLQVADLLGGEPVGETGRRFGVERFARVAVRDTVDAGKQGLGVGVRPEPGEGLDQASVQGVGGVAHHERGERVVEPAATGSLPAQPGQRCGFRVDADGAAGG